MSRSRERRARRAPAKYNQPMQGNSNQRPLWYAGGALAALFIAVLGYAVYAAFAAQSATTGGPLPTNLVQGTAVPNLGATHVNPGEPHARYNSTPPTSGPHFPHWGEWKRYDEPQPEEVWIHNLEHGGIVALYNCPQGCPELLNKLSDLYKTGPRSKYGYLKMLVSPYSKISNKLTLAAWNYYLPLDDYDDAQVRGFILAHQDKGPEDAQ